MEVENPTNKRAVAFNADTPHTPGWILDYVQNEFPINHEPLDILTPWKGFSFKHPAHEEAQLWVQKAVSEASKGNHSVLLVPANFNSIYWREIVYRNCTDIRILVCPFRRPCAKKPVNCQMALLIFAGRPEEEMNQCCPIFAIEPAGWEEHYYKRARNKARFTIQK